MSDLKQAAQDAIAERAAVLTELHRAPELSGINIPSLRKLLVASELVIWQPDTFQLAINGAECFEGLSRQDVAHLLPASVQYWSFDGFDLSNMATDTHYCGGLIFVPGRFFSETDQPCFLYALFPETSGLPVRFVPTKLHDNLTLGSVSVISLCAFMREKIAAKEPVLLPRADRRRMAREGKAIPEIRVIRLRGREASIWHGVAARKYHHSWIVRGHWRRLNKPRKSDSSPVTWIESYLKGDGPLLQPRQIIFSVSQ